MKPTRNMMAEALADLAIGLGAKEEDVPEGWLTISGWYEAFEQQGQAPARSTLAKRIRELVRSGQWEKRSFRIKGPDKIYPVPHYRKRQG